MKYEAIRMTDEEVKRLNATGKLKHAIKDIHTDNHIHSFTLIMAYPNKEEIELKECNLSYKIKLLLNIWKESFAWIFLSAKGNL